LSSRRSNDLSGQNITSRFAERRFQQTTSICYVEVGAVRIGRWTFFVAVLLPAAVQAQDFISSELSSERTIALIEQKDSDSKDNGSGDESKFRNIRIGLFTCKEPKWRKANPDSFALSRNK